MTKAVETITGTKVFGARLGIRARRPVQSLKVTQAQIVTGKNN